jgi:hypothetical protein
VQYPSRGARSRPTKGRTAMPQKISPNMGKLDIATLRSAADGAPAT